MSLIDQKPSDLPSTNALDDIEDPAPAVEIPPAYLSFGTTPCAIENPPADGDLVYYMVRARCTGEHGPVTRSDGEKRYKRDLKIQAIWLPDEDEPELEPEPAPKKKSKAEEDAEAEAAAADEQPALFEVDDEDDVDGEDPDGGWDTEDDDTEDDGGEEYPEDDGEDNVVPFEGGPAFSDGE